MEDQTEVLVPDFPEDEEKCANCGASCTVCEGHTGSLKLCSQCGYAELL